MGLGGRDARKSTSQKRDGWEKREEGFGEERDRAMEAAEVCEARKERMGGEGGEEDMGEKERSLASKRSRASWAKGMEERGIGIENWDLGGVWNEGRDSCGLGMVVNVVLCGDLGW